MTIIIEMKNNFQNNSAATVNSNELKMIENVLASINLSFVIFGTLGNLITFSILMRKNVRKHSYMRYLASLCLIDTFCLYTWNFSNIYGSFNGKKIEHISSIHCRIFSFFTYFILQSSSWVICSIGMDRIITVLFRNKLNNIAKMAKHTLKVIFSVLAIFFCFNFIVLINNAEPIDLKNQANFNNRTYTCYQPKSFYVVWDVVHIVMYSILPFSIIFIENISLSLLTLRHARQMNLHCKSMSYNKPLTILPESAFRTSLSEKIIQKFDKKKRVYKKSVNIQSIESKSSKTQFVANEDALALHAKRSKKMQSKGFHVANLLLFLTVSFFFTTVPYSTFYALRLNTELDLKSKNIVVGILTILQYTRHSANFLIYLLTSSIIKNEIGIIIINIKKFFSKKNNW